MRQLIKIHWGLFLYLREELKKKKSPKELVYFLRDTGKRYYKIILAEYKKLFLLLDSDYCKQKKEYDRMETLKKELNRALKMLHYIDDKFKKQGMPTWKRKQFWRDFFRDGQVRKDVFEDLSKELK